MGREVRRVPANWEHPENSSGDYQPLYDRSYAKAARDWLDNARAWDDGTHETLIANPDYKAKYPYFWEWDGNPPDPEYYRPEWTDEERTHFQMYETTSEGTPISPVMSSPEELARWLADNGASSFGSMTATYEQWLPICQGGWAPSMVMTGGRMMSGVEAMADHTSGEEKERG